MGVNSIHSSNHRDKQRALEDETINLWVLEKTRKISRYLKND
jgi:hypothetical protein